MHLVLDKLVSFVCLRVVKLVFMSFFLENYTREEQEVQQLVASMGVWKTILQSALPAFLIMFVGSWSDRWGKRKPCMLLPIVGELLTSIGLMVCTYFYYELPMEVAGFVEGLFPGNFIYFSS